MWSVWCGLCWLYLACRHLFQRVEEHSAIGKHLSDAHNLWRKRSYGTIYHISSIDIMWQVKKVFPRITDAYNCYAEFLFIKCFFYFILLFYFNPKRKKGNLCKCQQLTNLVPGKLLLSWERKQKNLTVFWPTFVVFPFLVFLLPPSARNIS